MAHRTVFFQGLGHRLTWWNVDVEAATLTPGASLELPSNIQYVWPHPSRKFLYVSTSDAASGNAPDPGKVHRLCAVRIAQDGTMALHGPPASLPQRPVHHSLDRTGRFALTCYNKQSDLSVHRIAADGTVGEEIPQPAGLDRGIFAHQIVTTPSNRAAIMPTRGNRAEKGKPEDPGALKVFGFDDGHLSPRADIRVGGPNGQGYGPRHVDFHPTRPWVYVCVEIQNELHMHALDPAGENLSPEPLFAKPSTIVTYALTDHQLAGGIHVHPSGRTVYISNRASETVEHNGRRVFRSGENNIAVFSIDPATGEPTVIQHADPQSYHVRTFSIDPTGRMLVAASIDGMDVRSGDAIHRVPTALTAFRIGPDGTLAFERKYDIDANGRLQWWTGFIDVA